MGLETAISTRPALKTDITVMDDNWLIGSDTLIEVQVQNATDGTYPTGAAVTAVLKDKDGTSVGGSLTGTYRSGSNGIYDMTLPDTTSLTSGEVYTLEVTTVSGSDTKLDKVTRTAGHAQG